MILINKKKFNRWINLMFNFKKRNSLNSISEIFKNKKKKMKKKKRIKIVAY